MRMSLTNCFVISVVLLTASCANKPNKGKQQAEVEPEKVPSPPQVPKTEAAPDVKKAPIVPQVYGEEIEYEADGVKLKGYMAYAQGATEPRPGILVVHEWWGHNEYTRKRARMLAEMGYTAFAIDMYGEGKNTSHPDDAKKFMMEVLGNLEQGVKRFEAAKNLLEKHATTDPAKTAAIGYCFGGAVVLHMARIGMNLDGVASFHGNLSPTIKKPPAQPAQIKAKILVLHGEADSFVPAEQVEKFKKEMAAAKADMKFVSYPGAKHAFTNPAATEIGKKFNIPLEYDADADQKSWSEFRAFLGRIF